MKLRSSKTKLFCETSFKNEAVKLKNEPFLRDLLQKWSFEALKRSFSTRLHSKLKLPNSKTKLFCETSFKNEASSSKTKLFCETSFKNEAAKLKNEVFCETSFKNDTSGTNRVTGDHKGDSPFSCDRCGVPSTLGHLWPYLFLLQHVETVNRVTSDQCPQRTMSPKAATLFCWWTWKPCKVNWTNPISCFGLAKLQTSQNQPQ